MILDAIYLPFFSDPERIIADAEAAGICCILTGSEARENELVNEFVKNHDVYGTAGIHPHAADDAADKDLERIQGNHSFQSEDRGGGGMRTGL